MNPRGGRSRFLLFAILTFSIIAGETLFGQSTNRQIGTGLTVTADRTVPRPPEEPACTVQLFSNFQFAHFSQSVQTFQFTPPTDCPGPWQTVVFQIDFSENPGAQFDRTPSVYLNNTNIYFGTTPEPLASVTNTWHVERDVTAYSALLSGSQQGTIVLANCTDDCPPPFNTLNGVFTVSASLQFYRANLNHPVQKQPDVVLPLMQINSSGGVNLPATLSSPTDQLATTFTLPENTVQAYLDVVSQSQSSNEQWYACFPNDLSAINLLFGCGNTDFRETEVTIDGVPAGLAPVSPWVFTGFLPDQWMPIPAAQTLDFIPYRVNLTPFAGLLSNGKPHTIAFSVFNDGGYFSATGSLLLFLDPVFTRVSGSVEENTLAAPNPVVTENLTGTATVTGTITVTSNRSYTITGYVDTSRGRVTTTVSQKQNFTGTQAINFDTVNFTVLDQNVSTESTVASTTTVKSKAGTDVTKQNFSFPITVDVIFPVPTALFGLTVATTQNYHTDTTTLHNGKTTGFASLTNTVSATDATPLSSSQQYQYSDSMGTLYNCEIGTANNVLTSVSGGCGP
jgi:hypothetical protein